MDVASKRSKPATGARVFSAPPVGVGLLVAKQTQTNPLHAAQQLIRGGGGGGLSPQPEALKPDPDADGNWRQSRRVSRHGRKKWWQSRIAMASAAGVMVLVIVVAAVMASRLTRSDAAAAAAPGGTSSPYNGAVGDNKTVADNNNNNNNNTTLVPTPTPAATPSTAPAVGGNSTVSNNSTAGSNSTAGGNNTFIPIYPAPAVTPYYAALAVGDPPITVPSGSTVELGMGAVTTSYQPQLLALWTSAPVGGVATGIAVARSYGDGSWEATAAGRAIVQNCRNDTRRCTVLVTGEGNLTLAAVRLEAPPTADQAAARLLLQATFGPSLATIAVAKAMGAKAWLQAQAALPATLHRAYFRARTNAKAPVTSNAGQALGPCDSGSRWRAFAFQALDVGQPLSVTFSGANFSGTATLAVSGVARTEIAASLLPSLLRISPSASITICTVAELDGMGGNVTLAGNYSQCMRPPGWLRNPAISFAASPDRLVTGGGTASLVDLSPPRAGLRLLAAAPSGCADALGSIAGVVNLTAFARADDGALYVYDARLALLENTVSAPVAVALRSGPQMTCPNVPKTFLNDAGCVASVAGACNADRFSSALFRLDSSALRAWYTLESRLVYAVSGLRLDDEPDPCAGGLSRWLRSTGACAAPTALAASTNYTIYTRLHDSAVPGEVVRDLTLRCSLATENKGASLTVTELDGTRACWRHVHPDEMSVYDFTAWSQLGAHPGNAFAQANGLPNPIAKFAAEQGGTVLYYPALHDMSRWTANKKGFPRLGRLGDTVDFAALPTELQGSKVAARFGAASTGVPRGGVVDVCGSPGEIASVAALGNRYVLQQFKTEDGQLSFGGAQADYAMDSVAFKASVFAGVALSAPDQLRQRVAWALSQIVVVTENQVDDLRTAEFFLQYYDIFVRNAFGTYGDVLREVSYSPAMGEMLSYVNGQSLPYSKRVYGLELFPDENYARELMQLFTIGLYELETDGSRRADGAQTYSNDDITTFARAWTGFVLQARRGNIESTQGFQSNNKIDPMRIIGERRDPFPKRNLRSGYIGDGLPPCSELGPRPFLRKGARWSLLGASPLPLLQVDSSSFATTTVLRLSLNASTSALYRELCRAAPDGMSCTYPSIVELSQNLPCDGGECMVDQPRVVRLSRTADPCSAKLPGYFFERPSNVSLGDVCREPMSKAWACPPGCWTNSPSNTTCLMQVGSDSNSTTTLCRINDDAPPAVYYEYVRQPCVQLSFFSGGRRVAYINGKEAMCADPLLPLAGEACCQRPSLIADQKCEFFGERMTMATAEKRCRTHWPASQNRTQCEWASVRAGCPEAGLYQFFWSAKACQVLAKLAPDGRIAIVHDVNSTFTREIVSASNHNWFWAVWDTNSSQLTVVQRCQGCQALSSGDCLCPARVTESQVFSAVPTVSEALARLTLGAVPADAAAGKQITGPDGVVAYTNNTAGTINQQTVFKLPGVGGWFRNARSDVTLPSGATFRNPPSFLGYVDSDARDAHHETKAVLDFFLYHSNTAPFVAIRLIQRLVTSNPSPRYVASVATAFRSGRYDDIGSGRYGCLLATVAAVLLDREARDASVDADPGAGLLREPLLKLLHALRALDFVPHPGREIEWVDLATAIGQHPHKAPSVFSFFKPESLLPGTTLASPEAEILTPPLMIRLLNGLMSLGKMSALTDCYDGFTVSRNLTGSRTCQRQLLGTEDPAFSAAGTLAYRPPTNATAAAVVDQLALLLTAGKLANSTRAILEREYVAAGGGAKGLQAVEQLIFTAPEFHSSGMQRGHAEKRGPRVVPQRRNNSARPYKAIVYIFLNGGADSFSMLAPHSECRGGRDVYAEYVMARQNIAINRTMLLPIRPVAGTQVCDVMGLHPRFAKLRDTYNAGDAALLAGIGNMVEPLNKTQYNTRTAKVPVSLFAHNAQQMATMTLEPEKRFASGVLGRVADALSSQGFSVGSYTLEGNAPVLLPEASFPPDVVHYSSGVMKLDPNPSSTRIRAALVNISAAPAAGVFSEYFASSLATALDRGAVLSAPLAAVSLKQPFAGTKSLAKELQTAAKLMASRKVIGTDRDIFYATLAGFDTHDNAYTTLADKYGEIDEALESFRQEMILQDLWNSSLVVVASEWGRCLSSNGLGTDHGWSGNYLALGGGVKGAQVLGSFPESLVPDSALDLGRGRMLPTTPWDAVWNAAAQWFGVAPERMDDVLPNRRNFNNLFQPADMFRMP